MTQTFVDEYPDIRLWHFRCIVDAGGVLLRCRPRAIPDAVILADPFDDWARTCLWECVTTRRELTAVPVFAYSPATADSRGSTRRNMTSVDWRELAEPTTYENISAYARVIAQEIKSVSGETTSKNLSVGDNQLESAADCFALRA